VEPDLGYKLTTFCRPFSFYDISVSQPLVSWLILQKLSIAGSCCDLMETIDNWWIATPVCVHRHYRFAFDILSWHFTYMDINFICICKPYLFLLTRVMLQPYKSWFLSNYHVLFFISVSNQSFFFYRPLTTTQMCIWRTLDQQLFAPCSFALNGHSLMPAIWVRTNSISNLVRYFRSFWS